MNCDSDSDSDSDPGSGREAGKRLSFFSSNLRLRRGQVDNTQLNETSRYDAGVRNQYINELILILDGKQGSELSFFSSI